eukprot:jgi/Chlat1/5406/Chrsp35S05309
MEEGSAAGAKAGGGGMPSSRPADSASSAQSPASTSFANSQQQSFGAVIPRFRHEWYQTMTHVTISIFAKGVTSSEVAVHFDTEKVEVNIEPNYQLRLHTFGKIVPDECKTSLGATKMELRLKKADQLQWATLEHKSGHVMPLAANYSTEAAPVRTYPTSHAKKPLDWDQLEAEVKREEKDEKLEGDAALNKLFQDIYRNADEDTRRAMNKSFSESGGTVLSTNWKEVGTGKVEVQPPAGLEPKKYES